LCHVPNINNDTMTTLPVVTIGSVVVFSALTALTVGVTRVDVAGFTVDTDVVVSAVNVFDVVCD